MVVKKVASYGDWESPFTSTWVVDGSRSMSSPRVCRNTGKVFYVQSRPGGGKTIIESHKGELRDILCQPYSVENTVYEYGASLFDVLPVGNSIVFSNEDNTVCLLDTKSGSVKVLINSPVLRYSSFNASPTSGWVLAIEEDHAIDTPSRIQNRIVAIDSATGRVKRIVEGADFYFMPSVSYNGKKISWLEWNHPNMVFDDAKVCWADFTDKDASVSNIEVLAGENGESVAEPRWGPDGSLFFCQETSSYRRLFRVRPKQSTPEEVKLDCLGEYEFGEVRLFEGSRTYAPLSASRLLVSGCKNGKCTIIYVDLDAPGDWLGIVYEKDICHVNFDAVIRYDDTSAIIVGSGTEAQTCVYRVSIDGALDILAESSAHKIPLEHVSRPEHIRITSKRSPEREIHGFLWRPRNAQYTAPEGELPPLVISSHGGPTGYSGCGLTLRTQYFTNRGYAYFLLNYTGSTGHGRAYRQGLYSNWGVRDTDDAAEFAEYFVKTEVARPGAVGITGISAGGYNTLQCLTMHPDTFASGFCVSGISDLERFDSRTHKLESNYTPLLVLPQGTDTPKDVRKRIFEERSALFHTAKVKSPLLLLHGKADTVVPLEQASLMAEALMKQENDVELIAVEGEGHMMAKPTSARLWLVKEEEWWRRTLLEGKTS